MRTPHPRIRHIPIRHMAAAFALIAIVPLGMVSVASAQESEGVHPAAEFVDKAAEECSHLLAEGKTVDDCQEAPSLVLPPTNEIVWGALSFTILFVLLAKFAFPGIKRGMCDRTARIQGDLDRAEGAKAEAEAILSEYQAKVADAKAESARIIEDARQTADQLKTDQQARLSEELTAARTQARAEIDAAKGQAMSELRGEVADIAIGAAEAVVGANLDRNAQVQLIEDYINRVGTSGQV